CPKERSLMKNDLENGSRSDRWARFRFAIVGPLLAAPPKRGELRTELMKIKTMIMAGGAIESPGRSKVLRRAVAKILTVINEEE
ncbi:MAG: 50S ribosomal protein L29, partial [Candidatus Bathyarchaeota archaeon]